MTNKKIHPGQHTDRINLHLGLPMKKKLVVMAMDRGVTLNEMVRVCIRDYFADSA